MADRTNLIPKPTTAFRDGKPYQTIVWVNPSDAGTDVFRTRGADLTNLVSAAAYKPQEPRFVADVDPHAPREVTDDDLHQDGDHAALGEAGDTCTTCGQTVAGSGLHGYPAERADLPGGTYPAASGYLALPATEGFDEGEEAVWASSEWGYGNAPDPDTLPYGIDTWAVRDRFAPEGASPVLYARGEERAWELANQYHAAHARAEDPSRYADYWAARESGADLYDLQERWRAEDSVVA